MIIQVVLIVMVSTIGLLLGYAISIRLCQSAPNKVELEIVSSDGSNDVRHSSSSRRESNRKQYDYSLYDALLSKNTSLESLPEFFDQESCSLRSMSSSATYCCNNCNGDQEDNDDLFITIDTSAEPRRDPFLTRGIITVNHSAPSANNLITVPLANEVVGEALA